MDSEDSAASLLRVLLRHYAERRSLPAQAAVYVPSATEKQGVLRIVRSAAGLRPCEICGLQSIGQIEMTNQMEILY